MNNEQRKDLLVRWNDAKQALAAWKEVENTLREQVLAEFADESKLEGTQNIPVSELDPGFAVLSVVKAQDYKLANKDQETQLLVADPENKIPTNLIKWEAKLNVKEWRKVVAEAKKGTRGYVGLKRKVETVLTIKPKSAQVSVK